MQSRLKSQLPQKIWIKLGLALLISILLLIPKSQISSLIAEREQYEQTVKKEVTGMWAKGQIAGAVVLSIPVNHKESTVNEDGSLRENEFLTHIHFLPEQMTIKAHIENTVRQRGPYKVPLYESELKISGHFPNLSQHPLELKNAQILWDQAILSVGIKDVKGLGQVKMEWNNEIIKQEVGEMPSQLSNIAVNGSVISDEDLLKNKTAQFSIVLSLKGSESLSFYPLGQTTLVEVTSNWGSPSFSGVYLPERHTIENENFSAQWRVLGLTRNLPKHWVGEQSWHSEMDASKFGVDLLLPLETYQLNTRSVKYSFLFILLTFVTMFFIEVLYKVRFHLMHYTMTGASLVLFYLLLLSFSEHLGFNLAYIIAAVATIATISLYVLGITKMKKGAVIVSTQLILVYGYLFILLRQENFTLLFGAAGLWVILALLMYATRKIDWFAIDQH